MALYKAKQYSGEYKTRQLAANKDKAVAYVEFHANGSDSRTPNYALAVVADNASGTSQRWGKWWSAKIAEVFGNRDNGIVIGGFGGRGNHNLKFTDMPAILLEPFFITSQEGAMWAKRRVEDQAQVLVASIRQFFPQGGLVALSLGHKGKPSKPHDRGVQSLSGEWEADLMEPVLLRAKALLEAAEEEPEPEEPDVPIPVDKPAPWAEAAVKWAVERGLSDGTRLREPLTRQEVLTLLHRMQARGEG